jgi:hypothetical protein
MPQNIQPRTALKFIRVSLCLVGLWMINRKGQAFYDACWPRAGEPLLEQPIFFSGQTRTYKELEGT